MQKEIWENIENSGHSGDLKINLVKLCTFSEATSHSEKKKNHHSSNVIYI